MAPARILTPLWTDNPDKMAMVSKEQQEAGWVTPETVAEVMLGLVEREEWVGGTIMEVGSKVREVLVWNDPGPGAGGNGVKPAEGFEDPMWASLKRQFEGV